MAQKYSVPMRSILIFLAACVVSLADSKSPREKSRFISFDSSSGDIDISLDLSVPFLSIPLTEKKENGQMQSPFVNVNTKALGVFGSLMAISTFIIPLFVKKLPGLQTKPANLHHQYRSHQDYGFLEDFSREILNKDGPVIPCLQSIICSAVASATNSNEPTKVDKIIDGMFRWFGNAVNGTVITDAVANGRKVSKFDECVIKYEGCSLNPKLVSTILNIVGV